MADSISGLIMAALDGLSARQAATAENIANASSPGFHPLRVTFEQALAAAAPRGDAAVRAVRPRIEADSNATGVRTDLELATASETALRYAALTELLGRRLQLESIATRGNQ
jgi:flagellar basal-body rod protein FlgB